MIGTSYRLRASNTYLIRYIEVFWSDRAREAPINIVKILLSLFILDSSWLNLIRSKCLKYKHKVDHTNIRTVSYGPNSLQSRVRVLDRKNHIVIQNPSKSTSNQRSHPINCLVLETPSDSGSAKRASRIHCATGERPRRQHVRPHHKPHRQRPHRSGVAPPGVCTCIHRVHNSECHQAFKYRGPESGHLVRNRVDWYMLQQFKMKDEDN